MLIFFQITYKSPIRAIHDKRTPLIWNCRPFAEPLAREATNECHRGPHSVTTRTSSNRTDRMNGQSMDRRDFPKQYRKKAILIGIQQALLGELLRAKYLRRQNGFSTVVALGNHLRVIAEVVAAAVLVKRWQISPLGHYLIRTMALTYTRSCVRGFSV